MYTAMIDLMKNRRSIRKYQERPIPEELLHTVLETATYAPTANGRQDPIMIAVTDEVERKKVSDLNASIRGIDSDPYYGAPAIVLILAKASDGAAAEDGSNVAIYLMLAAEACGLSSVWIAKEPEMFEKEEGKQLLRDWGVEGEYVGVAAVALGYAAGERPEAAPRKKDYIKYI